MELRVLNYFLVVAQTGNISTAAARLHVGQPTLSRQLKELERELGNKLFVRESHGIRLTEEGELLQSYAREMVDISHKVERDFATMRTKPLGDVHIGGLETREMYWLAECMALAHRDHPSMNFHHVVGSFDEVSSRLQRGLLDFAFVAQPYKIEKFESLRLPHEETWVAHLRADNPLAAKPYLTPDDLAHEPLLMYEQVMRAPIESNNVAAWFGDRFGSLDVVATSNVSFSNNVMACEGLGTLLTREGLESSSDESMVTRPLHPALTSWTSFVWCKDRPLTPAATVFLDYVKEFIDQQGE